MFVQAATVHYRIQNFTYRVKGSFRTPVSEPERFHYAKGLLLEVAGLLGGWGGTKRQVTVVINLLFQAWVSSESGTPL